MHLFLGRANEVIRVNKATGKVNLHLDISTFTPDGIEHLATDVELSSDHKMLFVPTGYYVPDAPATSGYVLAFDAATGQQRWTFEVPTRSVPFPGGMRQLDAAVYGLGVSRDLVIVPAGQVVYALDAATGTVRWERYFEADGFDANATVDGDAVYLGSVQERVYKMSLATGEILWEQKVSGSLTTKLTVDRGQVIFVSPFEGSLWVLDADDGHVILRKHPDDDALLAPAGVGKDIIVSVSSKRVYAFGRP